MPAALDCDSVGRPASILHALTAGIRPASRKAGSLGYVVRAASPGGFVVTVRIKRQQQDMHMVRHDREFEQTILRFMMVQQIFDKDFLNARAGQSALRADAIEVLVEGREELLMGTGSRSC